MLVSEDCWKFVSTRTNSSNPVWMWQSHMSSWSAMTLSGTNVQADLDEVVPLDQSILQTAGVQNR